MSEKQITPLSDETVDITSKVLDEHGLKKTALRHSIISTFIEAKSSLTQADLIERLSKIISTFDRASIYRNLASLTDKGVLHEVESNNYVFCSHKCSAHSHLLLYCQSCKKHTEVKDHGKIDNFMDAIGAFKFYGNKKPIFLKGVCKPCTKNL